MEKKSLQIILILLVLAMISLLLLFFLVYTTDESAEDVEEETLDGISAIMQLEKRNGIVINIWIDKENLDALETHGMKYLFVDVGDTQKDGTIKTSKNEIKEFLDLIEDYEKENNYDFILLPYSEVYTYDYDITSVEFRDNFIQVYSELIEWGFDGIYVDIEPVRLNQENIYLNLLISLRNDLPRNSIISVYSGSFSDNDERDNEWEWSSELYEKVADRVDLIFVPSFDFNLNNKQEYQDYLQQQFEKLSSVNFNSEFIFGVPTHKKEPESIGNALESYTLNQNSEDLFIGVGIFAEWTMDKDEWEVFENYLG